MTKCPHCGMTPEEQVVEDAMREAVSGCAAGPWIPVGERMPAEGVEVIVWHNPDGVYWAKRDDWGWYSDAAGTLSEERVSHWAEVRKP